MNRINLTLFTVLSLLLTSCQFMHYNDNENLGDGFYFVMDEPRSIIYSKEDNGGVDGTLVIPSSKEAVADNSSSVTDYNYNQKYIIAKTKGRKQYYWILDKSNFQVENSLNPLDSIQFYGMLSKNNIELKFKKL